MKNIFFVFIISGFILSCSKNDSIQNFNQDESYVYFAYPTTVNNAVEKFIDSLTYSFATDEQIGITSKTIAIPINIAGQSAGKDRTYELSVVSELSSYDPALIQISNPVIHANKFQDTLFITIKRGAALAAKGQNVVIDIVPNSEFKVGHKQNRRFKLAFTDVLLQPSWWNTWTRYMGPFYKEVFQKWMQIYYLGADPSPDLYGAYPGPYYYWNNMPTSATVTWYPVTFFYIYVLKQYFINNIVYPNGDNTKDRILLP